MYLWVLEVLENRHSGISKVNNVLLYHERSMDFSGSAEYVLHTPCNITLW